MVAGLAVGVAIRGTHGPIVAVASPAVGPQAVTSSSPPFSAPRPAAAHRASSGAASAPPPV